MELILDDKRAYEFHEQRLNYHADGLSKAFNSNVETFWDILNMGYDVVDHMVSLPRHMFGVFLYGPTKDLKSETYDPNTGRFEGDE